MGPNLYFSLGSQKIQDQACIRQMVLLFCRSIHHFTTSKTHTTSEKMSGINRWIKLIALVYESHYPSTVMRNRLVNCKYIIPCNFVLVKDAQRMKKLAAINE